MFAPNLHSYGGDKAKPSVSIHELAALLWRPGPPGFPSAASSRNKVLAISVLLDPSNCLLLLSYGVLTVTNPSAAQYKPVTVWPLSSAVICFQRISSPMR